MKLDEDIVASIKHESGAEARLGKNIDLDHKESYGTEESVAPIIGDAAPERSPKQKAEDDAPVQTNLAKDQQAKNAAKLLEGKNGTEEKEKFKPDELDKDAKPLSDEELMISGE